MTKLETCITCGDLISWHTEEELRKCYTIFEKIATLDGVISEE
jgi:hypothetical protein